MLHNTQLVVTLLLLELNFIGQNETLKKENGYELSSMVTNARHNHSLTVRKDFNVFRNMIHFELFLERFLVTSINCGMNTNENQFFSSIRISGNEHSKQNDGEIIYFS